MYAPCRCSVGPHPEPAASRNGKILERLERLKRLETTERPERPTNPVALFYPPHLAWDTVRNDPIEPAEDRLAQLSASVGPLRRVLAAVAERLLATRAYERLC